MSLPDADVDLTCRGFSSAAPCSLPATTITATTMYHYFHSPPPFYPVSPMGALSWPSLIARLGDANPYSYYIVGTPVAANVPLPPSPYGVSVGLPTVAHHYPHPHSVAFHPGYGPAPYVPFYSAHALPTAAAPIPQHQYQPAGTQLHQYIQHHRPPRIFVDFSKPADRLVHWNHSPVPSEIVNAPATWPACSRMRLVAPGFPWFIDIDTSKPGDGDTFAAGSPVTVGLLLQRIHAALRHRMTSSEWQICSKDKKQVLSANIR